MNMLKIYITMPHTHTHISVQCAVWCGTAAATGPKQNTLTYTKLPEVQFKSHQPKPPESVCSLPCEKGQAKKYVEGESCCWHCFNCSMYQVRHNRNKWQFFFFLWKWTTLLREQHARTHTHLLTRAHFTLFFIFIRFWYIFIHRYHNRILSSLPERMPNRWERERERERAFIHLIHLIA